MVGRPFSPSAVQPPVSRPVSTPVVSILNHFQILASVHYRSISWSQYFWPLLDTCVRPSPQYFSVSILNHFQILAGVHHHSISWTFNHFKARRIDVAPPHVTTWHHMIAEELTLDPKQIHKTPYDKSTWHHMKECNSWKICESVILFFCLFLLKRLELRKSKILCLWL